MSDMNATIIPKSDQINADDLIAGPRTIRVEGVQVRAGTEQPVSINIAGDRKVFRPCKSMCRVMVAAWGADSAQYVGRAMTLYRDPKVKWGGMEIGGIRISAMSHLDNTLTLALTETKASRKPFTVKPLQIERPTDRPSPAGEQPTEAGQEAATATGTARQTPGDWADEYVAKLASCDSAISIGALQVKNVKALAKIAEKHPDLSTYVMVETGKRLAVFEGEFSE